MKDKMFIRSKTPMTKEEVRAISIDKLNLQQAKKFMDIGSGTGSITVQAAISYPLLEVIAVEQNIDAISLIKENISKFECNNIKIIHGQAPLANITPGFDAIFVGGSGGNLIEIFKWCYHLLLPGGRLVLNFILLENAIEAVRFAEVMNWQEIEIISVQVDRLEKLGKGHYFKPQNPTIVVSMQKSKEF